MPKTVWVLRGSTDKVVECCLAQTPSNAHALSVVRGRETYLFETYPNEVSAVERAMQVRDGLLKSGGWSIASDQMSMVDVANPLMTAMSR